MSGNATYQALAQGRWPPRLGYAKDDAIDRWEVENQCRQTWGDRYSPF
jgi:hypothetical protein